MRKQPGALFSFVIGALLLLIKTLFLSLLLILSAGLDAKGTYMTAQEFLNSGFAGAPPQPSRLWLPPELKEQASTILNRAYTSPRVRYWAKEGKSAWIFEEIGKELPITIGVVIENNAVTAVTILAFRESRGDEVRYPFFTKQFIGAKLEQELKLDRHIDGITGATLSVHAVQRAVRLALYFHRKALETPAQ